MIGWGIINKIAVHFSSSITTETAAYPPDDVPQHPLPHLPTPTFLTIFEGSKQRLPAKIPHHTRHGDKRSFSPDNDCEDDGYLFAQIGAIKSDIGTVDTCLMDVEDFLEAIQKERGVDIELLQQLESQWNSAFQTHHDRYESWCMKNTKNIYALREIIGKLGRETSFNKVRQDAAETTKLTFFKQVEKLEIDVETNEKHAKASRNSVQILEATVKEQDRIISNHVRQIDRLEKACDILNKRIETLEADCSRTAHHHEAHFEQVLQHLNDRLIILEHERDMKRQDSADDAEMADNETDTQIADVGYVERSGLAENISIDTPTPATATPSESPVSPPSIINSPPPANTTAVKDSSEIESASPPAAPITFANQDHETSGGDPTKFLNYDMDAEGDLEESGIGEQELPQLQITPPTPAPAVSVNFPATSGSINIPATNNEDNNEDNDLELTIVLPPKPALPNAKTHSHGQSVSVTVAPEPPRRSPRLEKKLLPPSTPPPADKEIDFEPTP